MKKNKQQKVAIFGMASENYAVKNILNVLHERKIACDYFTIEEMFFSGSGTYCKNKIIDFSQFSHVIFRIAKYKSKKYQKMFNPVNELNVLIGRCERCFVLNKKIYQRYPFYNKFTQFEAFSKLAIPTIPTVFCTTNNRQILERSFGANDISFPIVAKKSYGSQGVSVFLLESEDEFDKFLHKYGGESIIFQKYIPLECDYRVLIVGGKSLGIIERKDENSWKNNLSLGGAGKELKDKKISDFAEKACNKMGFEFAGVDIINDSGKLMMLEINDVPGFKGFETVYPQINVSEKLIDWMLGQE